MTKRKQQMTWWDVVKVLVLSFGTNSHTHEQIWMIINHLWH